MESRIPPVIFVRLLMSTLPPQPEPAMHYLAVPWPLSQQEFPLCIIKLPSRIQQSIPRFSSAYCWPASSVVLRTPSTCRQILTRCSSLGHKATCNLLQNLEV